MALFQKKKYFHKELKLQSSLAFLERKISTKEIIRYQSSSRRTKSKVEGSDSKLRGNTTERKERKGKEKECESEKWERRLISKMGNALNLGK